LLINDSDANTQHIIMMIDKGIKKNLTRVTTPNGILARRIYVKIKFIRTLSFFGLVLLAFFEKPEWCINDKVLNNHSNCTPIDTN